MNDIPQRSLAVFIDYENFAYGAAGAAHKRTSRTHRKTPDMKSVFGRLVDKGRITVKRAYCDWQRFKQDITPLHELGIELIEIPDRSSTGKNSADIRLAVDATEMCLTKEHIDTFAILSGDSDFSPLVAKLKEFGKTVIGIGAEPITAHCWLKCAMSLFFTKTSLRRRVSLSLRTLFPPKNNLATSYYSKLSMHCNAKTNLKFSRHT